jgi:Uma2 family endonuclease
MNGPSENRGKGSPTMSAAIASKTHYTPEDLLFLADSDNYELVDGRLVERHMGLESSWVGARLVIRLGRYAEDHELGWTFLSENGYQCFPHKPSLVRRPDVSFIRRERLPEGRLPKGWAIFPPDLAVEVVSPNDLAESLEVKLTDYRKAGVPLLWVIYPGARTVRVHHGDGSARCLDEFDELLGEDVIPGFRCTVREILPPREQGEEAQSAPVETNGPQ